MLTGILEVPTPQPKPTRPRTHGTKITRSGRPNHTSRRARREALLLAATTMAGLSNPDRVAAPVSYSRALVRGFLLLFLLLLLSALVLVLILSRLCRFRLPVRWLDLLETLLKFVLGLA